jgi:hypothetical protein
MSGSDSAFAAELGGLAHAPDRPKLTRSLDAEINQLLIRQMADALMPKGGAYGGKSGIASDVSRTMFVDAISVAMASNIALKPTRVEAT